ncbi:MAG: PilC/PilY family type IV pilus protein [Betaproteobacteria bacterium]|nr:PilC/PilY family type IV pilus protein [Betaproteobacteria bacterium]
MSAKIATKWICLASGLLALSAANAQVATYKEDFSGTSTNLSWKALNDACLTASGNGSNNTGSKTDIPKCSTKTPMNGQGTTMFKNTTGPDSAGKGALMLTPALVSQTGAVISNFTFDASQGLSLVYTTYTYGLTANNGYKVGSINQGADGIVFILSDGTAPMPSVAGGQGGALGYSCIGNQRPGDSPDAGFANAYLGVGTDEWGNFLNSGDNGPTLSTSGINITSANNLTNVPTGPKGSGNGPQYQANRIGIRGGGNITSSGYSTDAALRNACNTAIYYKDATGKTYGHYDTWSDAYYVLPSAQKIVSSVASLSQATALTYKLTISTANKLNFYFKIGNGPYTQVLPTDTNITTRNPPLPAKLRFGFTAGTGAANNVHEIGCFVAAPLASNSSAGANTTTGQVQIGSQLYLANYNANDWSGTVQAIPVMINSVTGDLSLSSTPNWDANCVLTGGYCASTGAGSGTTNASGSATPLPLPGSNTTGSARVLLTSNSTTGAGLAFQYTPLNTAEQSALGATSAVATNTVNWLRGDRSTELSWGSTPGTLRARASILGDIINSSPTWVGPPQGGAFPDGFSDFLYTGTPPETPFSGYVSGSAATRQPVVYAGSNDGFLHAFRTGGVDSLSTALPNDGQEVLGFMPAGQLINYAAGIASPGYQHSYVVDATPTADDLFYGGAWHTWVVGGVGSTGQEIYALDVTNPDNFSASQAGAIVMGDWTPANTSTPLALNHLNCTVGSPMIKRLHNGQWGIIFGNGLPDVPLARCRQTLGGTTAGIYVGVIDSSTGKVASFQWIDTGAVGTTAAPNGIAYVSPVDVDGDFVTDYVYAGDVLGNLWRFDLTSSDPNTWSTTAPTKLFQTSVNGQQPITTAPIVAAVTDPTRNSPKPLMMVYFGTGRLAPSPTSSTANYASGSQSFYGIWDWNWAGTHWAGLFASLTSGPSPTAMPLFLQSSTESPPGYRKLSNTNKVCWADLAACGSTPYYGWKYNFPDSQEQVIYNPMAMAGAIVVNTAEPPTNSSACDPGQQQGWTMAFNPTTGGGFPQDFFRNSGGGFSASGMPVSGVRKNAVGTPGRFNHDGKTYFYSQSSDATSRFFDQINPPPISSINPARVSWRELRH